MSNRDIGKLYSESVSTKKFNTICSRFTEATVTIQYSDGQKQTYKDIPDETARTLITSNDLLYTLPGICKKWVSLGGWTSTDSIDVATNSLIKIFRNVFGDDLNNPEVITKLSAEVNTMIQTKESGTLDVFNGILPLAQSGEAIDLFGLIQQNHPEFELLTHIDVLSGVHNVVFSEANVNVGSGEVLITLYTEAVNPDEGDLMLPNGTKVELKAGDGRPGKAGVYSRIAKFEQYIKRHMKDTYESEMINTVSNVREVLISNIQQLLMQYDPKKYTQWPAGEQKYLKNWYETITKVYDTVTQTPETNYKQICIYLDSLKKFYKKPTSSTGATQAKLYNIISNEIPETLQWLLNLQDVVITRTESQRKPSPGDTVIAKSHFAAYDMTKTYSGNLPEESLYSLVEDISIFSMNGTDASVREVIKDVILSSGLAPSAVALKIIGAIQIVDYGLEDEFDYFMLMVDPKTGSKSIVIGPMGESNYTSTLSSCINTLIQHDAHVLPDTGGRGKNGYNVGIK